MAAPAGDWSTHQLTEFLAEISSRSDERAALRGAVERAAEALEAEVGAVVRDGYVAASVGFPADDVPVDDLIAVARGEEDSIDVPGIGTCGAVVVTVDDTPPAQLVMARFGSDEFTRQEVNLLSGMARVLALTLRTIRTRVALEMSEKRFRSASESAMDGIVSADSGGRITYFNRAAEKMFGYLAAEVTGRPLTVLIPERFQEAHQRAFQRFLVTREPQVIGRIVELVGKRKCGTEFPLELSLSSWTTDEGMFFTAIIRDITERKLAEDELRERGRQLAEAQRVASIGSWEWDVQANKMAWSEELYRICGIDLPDFDGSYEGYLSLVHPDDRGLVDDAMKSALSSGETFEFDHRIRRPDGNERIVHSWGEILMGEGGSPLRMFGISQDITERYAMDRMKDEFVSVVSHELRTPLTSIRGALGLLAGGATGRLPEKSQRMLEIALANADRLSRLLNDILDIEHMESGRPSMNKQRCCATDLMAQAREEMATMAAAAGVTLSIRPIRAEVWADPDRILQTLTNLLSNAIKFSPERGQVRLVAQQEGDHVLFQVRDQGRGIPTDKLESIFGRFQQVDSSDSREKGGTGLGLAICQSIVKHHGGTIWAESAEGRGSTFSFTLPTAT